MRDLFFKTFNIMESSSDAGLRGADRWGVIEAKLNNSFQKHELEATNVFDPQNSHKSTSRASSDIISIPIDKRKHAQPNAALRIAWFPQIKFKK